MALKRTIQDPTMLPVLKCFTLLSAVNFYEPHESYPDRARRVQQAGSQPYVEVDITVGTKMEERSTRSFRSCRSLGWAQDGVDVSSEVGRDTKVLLPSGHYCVSDGDGDVS
jgi:hypothetical protein